jgi:hypothetical protein
MHVWIALSSVAMIVALAAGAVAVVAAIVYASARRPKEVTCPGAYRSAVIHLNPKRAVMAAIAGHPRLIVRSCSLWPRRQRCGQGCVTTLDRAASPRARVTV